MVSLSEDGWEQLMYVTAMGCKRIIIDKGYLNCLHRPNVSLEWEDVVEVVKDGVVTRSGMHDTILTRLG
jgi:hypothetical protein